MIANVKTAARGAYPHPTNYAGSALSFAPVLNICYYFIAF